MWFRLVWYSTYGVQFRKISKKSAIFTLSSFSGILSPIHEPKSELRSKVPLSQNNTKRVGINSKLHKVLGNRSRCHQKCINYSFPIINDCLKFGVARQYLSRNVVHSGRYIPQACTFNLLPQISWRIKLKHINILNNNFGLPKKLFANQ